MGLGVKVTVGVGDGGVTVVVLEMLFEGEQAESRIRSER